MARRKSRKLDPSPMSIWYQIGDKGINETGAPSTYIDLAKDLSNINRRFYRQGMNYAIGGFRVGWSQSRNTDVDIAIQTLPTTWPVGAAWHKFFAAWQNQQNEALEALDGKELKGRWNDFKIYFDKDHKGDGSIVPTTPGGFFLPTQSPHNEGEWQYSQIVTPTLEGDDPAGEQEFYLSMLGDDTTVVKGMIKHYGLSRNYPQSPDPAQGNPQTSVLSQMALNPPAANDAVVINATDYNDELPYNQDNYIGTLDTLGGQGYLHREITLIATSTSNYKTVEGCLAPCGLLKISHNAPEGTPADALVVQVLLVPGPYKGVLAEPMQEMN